MRAVGSLSPALLSEVLVISEGMLPPLSKMYSGMHRFATPTHIPPRMSPEENASRADEWEHLADLLALTPGDFREMNGVGSSMMPRPTQNRPCRPVPAFGYDPNSQIDPIPNDLLTISIVNRRPWRTDAHLHLANLNAREQSAALNVVDGSKSLP